MGQRDTSWFPQYLNWGDAITSVPLIFVDFMAFYFTKRLFYFNVDKEASASASGGLRPTDPLPRLCPGSRWGTSVPWIPCYVPQPWKQVDTTGANRVWNAPRPWHTCVIIADILDDTKADKQCLIWGEERDPPGRVCGGTCPSPEKNEFSLWNIVFLWILSGVRRPL